MSTLFTQQGFHVISVGDAQPVVEQLNPQDAAQIRQELFGHPADSDRIIYTIYDRRDGDQDTMLVDNKEVLSDGEKFASYVRGKIVFHDATTYSLPHSAFAMHEDGMVLVSNLFQLRKDNILYHVEHRLTHERLFLDDESYRLLQAGLGNDMNWLLGLQRLFHNHAVDADVRQLAQEWHTDLGAKIKATTHRKE